jgi:hypothetical protein
MNQLFWIGVYPGITAKMLDYMLEVFHEYAAKQSSVAGRPRPAGTSW